jgi:hypothetical protein
MYRNIYCECTDNTVVTEVVAFKTDPHGNRVLLQHCKNNNRLLCSKHKQGKPFLVKPKKQGKFAIEFVCIGTHGDEFEPITVVLQILRENSAPLESPEFTLIGSRDEKRIKTYAPSIRRTPVHPSPLQEKNETDQRANPPPTTPIIDIAELFSLGTSADHGNPDYSVESIDTQKTDSDDRYEGFTRSRL